MSQEEGRLRHDAAEPADDTSRGSCRLLIATTLLAAAALAMLYRAYAQGEGEGPEALRYAAGYTLKVIPLFFFALIVYFLSQKYFSAAAFSRWIGQEAGWRGLLIGSAAGALVPGGPIVCMTIGAGLLKAGATVGILVAFVTSWALFSISRVPIELAILGWKFTLIRVACTFFVPPMAGVAADWLMRVGR